MLRLFKAGIKLKENNIVIEGRRNLVSPIRIYIPGDISSAGFFMVLAAIIPESKVLIKKVSLNPSRIGIIRVLKRMGAYIKVTKSQSHKVTKSEPMGDILVKSSSLRATRVRREEVPSLIDELPILMVTACHAKGTTVFEGVGELRVKETDRISSMSENLIKMGAKIEAVKTGNSENVAIHGVRQLKGASVKSYGDHRTAMSMIVAGLAAVSNSRIDDVSCINKSFPDFLNVLRSLVK
jgi:3-phosphoshikimate 1-carboxyvinyltransferase